MTHSCLLPFAAPSSHSLAPQDSQWLLGPSPAAAQLWLQIRRVAPHFRAAVLLGEPGSGAEHAARVLHQLSPLADRSFITLSADQAETRFCSRGHHGIEGLLFLPELERLSPAAQAGLLQFLRRRGGHAPRVLAASSHTLRTLTAATGFNAELAAALGVIHISLPALRERTADIATLAAAAVQCSAQARNLTPPNLSQCLLDAARACLWPGNLDQLRAAFDWLVEVHGNNAVLYSSDLESALAAIAPTMQTPNATTATPAPRLLRLDAVVQEHVRSILNASQGNKLRAAEILGISRSTLYRMLDQNTSASHSVDEFAIAV